MDDQTPLTPTPVTPEEGEMKPVAPDPHAAANEPAPPPQEGTRPEAVRSGVRPEQDEPLGPMAGLVTTSAVQAEAEATGDDDAEALLASMGVEDEGIEGGQLLGIMAAVLVSIAALCVAMYFLFFSPALSQTEGRAESDVRYEELEVVRTEGRTKISQYGLSADSAYTLPIAAAMEAVANDYPGGGAATPQTRGAFNTAVLPRTAASNGALVPADSVAGILLAPVAAPTGEEVGVDRPTADVIEVEPDTE